MDEDMQFTKYLDVNGPECMGVFYFPSNNKVLISIYKDPANIGTENAYSIEFDKDELSKLVDVLTKIKFEC